MFLYFPLLSSCFNHSQKSLWILFSAFYPPFFIILISFTLLTLATFLGGYFFPFHTLYFLRSFFFFLSFILFHSVSAFLKLTSFEKPGEIKPLGAAATASSCLHVVLVRSTTLLLFLSSLYSLEGEVRSSLQDQSLYLSILKKERKCGMKGKRERERENRNVDLEEQYRGTEILSADQPIERLVSWSERLGKCPLYDLSCFFCDKRYP